MQDFEKELSKLKFTQPPRWLKARALLAAQNAYSGVARRRKYYTIAAAAAASVMIALVVSFHFLGAFGLLARGGGSPIHATGVQSFGMPTDFTGGDSRATVNESRSEPESPKGSTVIAENESIPPKVESTATVESTAS